MSVVELPPLQLVWGQPCFFEARFMEGDTPVDFTGWTGEFIMQIDHCAPDVKADVSLSADGYVTVELDSDKTKLACADEALQAPRTVGVFQIILTAPLPEFNEIWQGNVAITGVLQ